MKKWIKRIGVFVGVVFLLVVIGFVIEWKITVNAGKNRLAKVRATLDAAEPGWQLDQLNTHRDAKLPPDEQNVALLSMKVLSQTPKEFREWENKSGSELSGDLKPNHLADPARMVTFRKRFEPIKPLITQLHAIRKYPTGGFVVVFEEPDVLLNHFSDAEKIRNAVSKLHWQMILSTQDNDPDAAIEACRTQFHLRHAIGDEPTLISQVIRMTNMAISVGSAERTLGMTEPNKGLAELQADYEKSLQETDFVSGIEGERAIRDRYYDHYANGFLWGTPSGPSNLVEQMYANRIVYDNHAEVLKVITAYRDAAKLKGKERADALKSVPVPNMSKSTMFAVLLAPSLEKSLNMSTRAEAKLNTMIAAIACERYRHANGKWPEKLSDIPKEILKEIPIDSYVGGLVKYKRNKTGIVVYTTGFDGIDDGGEMLDTVGLIAKPKTDFGVQLFDPAYRRLPAEVKPKVSDEGPEPLQESDLNKN